ncbi:MAG: plasma-membrane proton-efflux P-type ATPase [Deltaproteobacteria bacterium]|jgi:H+-transporting ATPase
MAKKQNQELDKKPLEELKDLPVDQTLERLGTSPEGLSKEEVEKRLQEYGYNELEEKRESAILLFLSFFRGTIPYMIMAAALISGILHHIPTLIIILVLLFLNAIIGFREEHQAGNAIEALKEKLAVKANVRRQGEWMNIEARELVPGDIVRLRIGSVIPADAKLLEGDPVKVDQAALTGESMPVEHKTGDMVYSGSILKQGEIDAVVLATGVNTYFGKTAQLVESAKTKSHLQIAIMKMADYLLVAAIVLSIVIIAFEYMRTAQILTVLQFVLVLIVAAVPVAMPAVLSVTMALGAGKLAEEQAVVTKLSAVEEMAGVDILCSDKTGTLTQGQLSPGDPFTVEGVSAEDVVFCGALASREEDQDPIDLAVLSGIKDKNKLEAHTIAHFMPFDPVHKRTEASVKGPEGEEFKTTKGAPQVIVELDEGASKIRDKVDEAIDGFAARGFRSLGVARTKENGKWQFLGIIPLYDPLREDTKPTIEAAQKLGLKVKMVTGDQIAIAKEIARQLDLGTNIMDAAVFAETKHHESGQVAEAIEKADGFAQVFPEHKYHIVDVLQQRGHIVGMTGDGVNDAPALKKADAGIAVSGATDAARSAASIALLNPGLSVIVHAVRESRRIFERMLSYAVYRIAETLALLGFITIVIVAFKVYPVTPIMIVFLAILNDGSILSIAYDNTRSASEPLRWKMGFVMGLAGVLGGYAIIRSLGIYLISLHLLRMDVETVKTMIYLNLSVGGILTLYAARTRGPFWSVAPAKTLLIVTFGAQAVATLLAVFGLLMKPIGWTNAGIVWGYCLVLFLVQDWVKLGARRIFSEEHSGYFGRHGK